MVVLRTCREISKNKTSEHCTLREQALVKVLWRRKVGLYQPNSNPQAQQQCYPTYEMRTRKSENARILHYSVDRWDLSPCPWTCGPAASSPDFSRVTSQMTANLHYLLDTEDSAVDELNHTAHWHRAEVDGVSHESMQSEKHCPPVSSFSLVK